MQFPPVDPDIEMHFFAYLWLGMSWLFIHYRFGVANKAWGEGQILLDHTYQGQGVVKYFITLPTGSEMIINFYL